MLNSVPGLRIAFVVFLFAGLTASCSGGQRELNFPAPSVSVTEADSYFSLYRHGPATMIYQFLDQNAVVVVTLSLEASMQSRNAEIHLFERFLSDESISSWVNNRFSDAIVLAPTPLLTYDIPDDQLTILSQTYLAHYVGDLGDEYDAYRIAYRFEDVSVEGKFRIGDFEDHAAVYLRTKDIDQ